MAEAGAWCKRRADIWALVAGLEVLDPLDGCCGGRCFLTEEGRRMVLLTPSIS